MQAVKDQFLKCKYIFMQNKIILPTLIGLLFGVAVLGFSFGDRLVKTESKINDIQDSHKILHYIKISVDSLLKKE